VNKTIRFYVPVARGDGSPVALRIVVHEMAGQKAEIDGVELYDIIKERPHPSSEQFPQGKGTGRGAIGRLSITVNELLSGVNDMRLEI
jgi:hypothetical protein